MAIPIGSAPRPTAVIPAANTAPTTQTAAPVPAAGAVQPDDTFVPIPKTEADTFTSKDFNALVSAPHATTPDAYKAMSADELMKVTPEQVKGMTMGQLMEYTKNIDKEGGVGRNNLDPKLGMALAMKDFINNMMLRCMRGGR